MEAVTKNKDTTTLLTHDGEPFVTISSDKKKKKKNVNDKVSKNHGMKETIESLEISARTLVITGSFIQDEQVLRKFFLKYDSKMKLSVDTIARYLQEYNKTIRVTFNTIQLAEKNRNDMISNKRQFNDIITTIDQNRWSKQFLSGRVMIYWETSPEVYNMKLKSYFVKNEGNSKKKMDDNNDKVLHGRGRSRTRSTNKREEDKGKEKEDDTLKNVENDGNETSLLERNCDKDKVTWVHARATNTINDSNVKILKKMRSADLSPHAEKFVPSSARSVTTTTDDDDDKSNYQQEDVTTNVVEDKQSNSYDTQVFFNPERANTCAFFNPDRAFPILPNYALYPASYKPYVTYAIPPPSFPSLSQMNGCCYHYDEETDTFYNNTELKRRIDMEKRLVNLEKIINTCNETIPMTNTGREMTTTITTTSSNDIRKTLYLQNIVKTNFDEDRFCDEFLTFDDVKPEKVTFKTTSNDKHKDKYYAFVFCQSHDQAVLLINHLTSKPIIYQGCEVESNWANEKRHYKKKKKG